MAFQAAQWIPFFRPRRSTNVAPAMPRIDYRSAIAALEAAGFWILREGVHVIMTNGSRILTIPCNDPIHPLTMAGIVRDAGLSLDQFHQLL